MKKIIILFALLISVNVGKSFVDKKSTGYINKINKIEVENPLLLENWMLNDSIWNGYYVDKNKFEIVQDNELVIEDWMLDSSLFINLGK